MGFGPEDAVPSSTQVRSKQLKLKSATRGVEPTTTGCVTLALSPAVSVTVRVTLRTPPCGYVAVTTGPSVVPSGDLSRSQKYEAMGLGPEDAVPSSTQVSPLQPLLNLATGGVEPPPPRRFWSK